MDPLRILYLAAVCVGSVAMILAAGGRFRIPPFLSLIAAAFATGIAAGLSADYAVKLMALGFAAAIESAGLLVLAGGLIGALVEGSGAAAALAARSAGRSPSSMTVAGATAGLTGSAVAAFALLMPLAAAGTRTQPPPAARTLALALAALAVASVALPGPGPVAAATILDANPWFVVLWGLLAASAAVAAGHGVTRLASGRQDAGGMPQSPYAGDADHPQRPARCLAGLALLPLGVPLLLLIGDAVAQMPSEPLGRHVREALSGFGSPMMVLIVGVALGLLLPGTRSRQALAADGWLGTAIGRAAGLVVTLGAAGSLAQVLQSFGLGEEMAEALVHAGPGLGILLPFFIAAVVKTVQGSTLVAAITAAGFTEPALAGLGLDGEQGRALAAVAVGAGSLCACHVNDPFFWMVADGGGMTPGRTFRLLTAGSLLQALSALAVLVALSALLL